MEKTEAEIVLPKQENFFSTEKLRRSARAGTHLPDPTMVPYGYDAKARFNHLFPALELPALFPPGRLHPDDHVSFDLPELPPHQLYLGDNLYVLRGLPSGSIDLIYIDPPFFSNRTYTQIWGDDNEVRSFGDIFQDGMFSYLAWMNARLWEMKRVLKPTGSIYVHCDWHASHYIKCEMDKIFGYDNFLNENVWSYKTGGVSKKWFSRKHDVIFAHARNLGRHFFDVQYGGEFRTLGMNYDEQGRPYKTTKKGRLYFNPEGSAQTDVWDIPFLSTVSSERMGYPTQKPEALLERIIRANSEPGDVVGDFSWVEALLVPSPSNSAAASSAAMCISRRGIRNRQPHD